MISYCYRVFMKRATYIEQKVDQGFSDPLKMAEG